jgi:hypothetical protein
MAQKALKHLKTPSSTLIEPSAAAESRGHSVRGCSLLRAALLSFSNSALNEIDLMDLYGNGNPIAAVLYFAAHSQRLPGRKSTKQLRDVAAAIFIRNVDAVGRVKGPTEARLSQTIQSARYLGPLAASIFSDLSVVKVVSLRSFNRRQLDLGSPHKKSIYSLRCQWRHYLGELLV